MAILTDHFISVRAFRVGGKVAKHIGHPDLGSQAEHTDSGMYEILWLCWHQHFSPGFRDSLFSDTPFLLVVFRSSFSVLRLKYFDLFWKGSIVFCWCPKL